MINNDIRSWTVSNLFIVPILKIGRERLLTIGFINSFLHNEEEDIVYDNAIYLLFLPPALEEFNNFVEEERERGSSIIDEHDYPSGYVILTYLLPEKFEKDYALIKAGKYSELSTEYKKLFQRETRVKLANGLNKVELTIQHMVFSKHLPLRRFWEKEFGVMLDENQELWTKPSLQSETFKLENYERSTADAT